mmetsp:Transcript_30360/g.66473  ORF Transcript_30360/g.66473 Transcript_30360/m.66473 type:complete len:338 (+) Transcript_30360:58-1071(+)|eukprot:CAMPEP_0170595316 /NCGR_PEP_ID=MMETSP0224-20130122/14493_1 /TAXON_ID=285029 /ORGANISM="Togula jolla, Strain CCCM 725" /LENGTH=337 /DNA_ID=CAMNT_0010919481 /DNA_START=51 /DNA_END=1064 /DNA_ORIENTATION=-
MATQRLHITSVFSSVQWVPDDTVNACQLCSVKFGSLGPHTWRKHHCRACGKVVCCTCSNNLVYKERVCDPCFDLHQTENAVSLIENHSTQREVLAALKADLKEKDLQLQWVKKFLVRIGPPVVTHDVSWGLGSENVTVGVEKSSFDEDFQEGGEERLRAASTSSSISTAPDRGSSELTSDDAAMLAVIAGARRRWRELKHQSDVSAAQTASLRRGLISLKHGCEESEKAASSCMMDIRDLKMELEIRNRPELEMEVDQLSTKIAELRMELEGLVRRRTAMEAAQKSTSFFGRSFSSGSSVAGSSVAGSSVADSDRAAVRQRCTERCSTVRERNCIAM